MKYLILLIFLSFSLSAQASVDTSRFLQLVDYIGVDYPEAVKNGEIISAEEYDEMQEFAETVLTQARLLDKATPGVKLTNQAETLQGLILKKADPAQVGAVTASMRQKILKHFQLQTTPHKKPDLKKAKALYLEQCASCHGDTGLGNGPLAKNLEPAPTNFQDVERYRERTLFGLYSTISIGVEGTAMQGYAKTLSEAERWSLAFYTGQLAASDSLVKQGSAVWSEQKIPDMADMETVTTFTPAEAQERFGQDGLALMAYLRSHPEKLFKDHSALEIARQKTTLSLQTYESGDAKAAYQHALSAYLDGFELAEQSVATLDHDLMMETEKAMIKYREMIKQQVAISAVSEQASMVLNLLGQAGELVDSKSLSTAAAFTGAFIILLREGLEALLVVAALAAFLIKTQRRDGLRYLHFGWVGALLLGAATWLGSQYLFDFSGANREITEGIAALVAMAVLFYVGFWLHSKTSAVQWKRFIEGSISKALSSGALWGIAGLSFIAVYREVFETILFYQAMWVQAESNAQASLASGFVAGAVVLAVLAWVILRYSARLPLRQFFSYTSVFMFALAIIFAGKGVAALQEAGQLSFNPVDFPRIDLLGIYPNLEGLILQAVLLITALAVMFNQGRKQVYAPGS